MKRRVCAPSASEKRFGGVDGDIHLLRERLETRRRRPQHDQRPGLPPGEYSLLLVHDENGNGKLDTNVVGMPLEGYGFSNNPAVMRKPTWEEAGFEVTGSDAAIDILSKYRNIRSTSARSGFSPRSARWRAMAADSTVNATR